MALDLLVLGGTKFLGRHLVQLALERGHRLTLLHRGVSGPGLFPDAEHVIADRNGDLSTLDGRRFDAVFDTSAYVPRQVRAVAARLAGRIGQYQLVSSISVYAAFDAAGPDEDAPLATLDDPITETVDGQTYGGLKALCEAAAREAFGEHALIVRPGLIVGPFDPSGRFTWWARRYAEAKPGEPVIAPGPRDAPVQWIDARDAAAWMLAQAEGRRRDGVNVFNLTGPAAPLSMHGFVDALRRTLAPDALPVWLDESFLLAEGVAPWTGLPVWLPAESAGLHRTRIDRALAAGFTSRAIEETIADTAAWAAQAPEQGLKPGIGLPRETEASLLAKWATRGAPGGSVSAA